MPQNNLAKGLSIGIIMDGNGRWAKKRGLPRTAGHKKGGEVFQDITRYCNEIGVQSVTYYAFSTENWKRPEKEVTALMNLFYEHLKKAFNYENENNRIVFLGDKSPIDKKLQDLMLEIEEKTKDRTGMTVNIAVNYGGRDEILSATKAICSKVLNGELNINDIKEQDISNHLYTKGQKDPDFILRPSGEKRISNFMIWQASYSELIYMDVLWPDFTKNDLDFAINEFHQRNRRFGGV